MICARCDQPILQGEEYEDQDKFSASGAGAAMAVHKDRCPEPVDVRRKEWRQRYGL